FPMRYCTPKIPNRNAPEDAELIASDTPAEGFDVVERAFDRMRRSNPPPTYGCRLPFPTIATMASSRLFMPSKVTPLLVPDRPLIANVSVSAWKDWAYPTYRAARRWVINQSAPSRGTMTVPEVGSVYVIMPP